MIYRFADCEIDPGRHEFRRAGAPRQIEPQVFDIITHLARNPDRLISRDELVETIWKGRIVSESAIAARINAARKAVGDSGARQAVIATVPRRGVRLVAAVTTLPASGDDGRDDAAPPRQSIRFCRSGDGTRIAWATTGSGPPLVRAGHWLTHLEHDWQSPVWRPILDALGGRFSLTRYDQRGCGLSDPVVGAGRLDDFVDDLEAVVEAAGLTRFALYGTSQGAPIAVRYALRRPDRVGRLILQGGFVRGRMVRGTPEALEEGRAIQTIIRQGWGKSDGPMIQALSAMFIPDATREQVKSLTEMQKISATPANAVAIREAVDRFDVSDDLARLRVPTLVMHARNDGIQPLDEGRMLAAGIPGASFVMLESASHVLLPGDPAFGHAMREMTAFATDA